MNESKILRLVCKPGWYAHAYSEYLADVAQNMSNLIGAVEETINSESADSGTLAAIKSKYGIADQARYIIGDNLSIPVDRLLLSAASYAYNGTDLFMSTYNVTTEEVLANMREVYSQVIISSKAFLSFEKYGNAAADRVTSFLQDVTTALGEPSSSLRNTLNYYKDLVSASTSIEDFAEQYLIVSGVEQASTGSSDLYANCDLSKYTGVTPGIALDFSEANKAIESTVVVTANAIKGIFSAIKRGVSWLFNKTKEYVVDTVIDPAVVDFVDGDENTGLLDGFAYFGEFTPNATYSYFPTGAGVALIFNGFADAYANRWIKIETIFGEILFKFKKDTVWQVYYKPVSIDINYLWENTSSFITDVPYVSQSKTLDENLDEFISWIELVSPWIRPVQKDVDKKWLYLGFGLSSTLLTAVCHAALFEVYYKVRGSSLDYSGFNQWGMLSREAAASSIFNPAHYNLVQYDDITNAAIITAAAGDPSSADNIMNYVSLSSTGISLSNSIPRYAIRTMMTNFISIWALCRRDRSANPSNYTFVPYSNNHNGFASPSWRVKSDNEIAETRDSFIERAIMAVIVVAAVAFIGVGVSKMVKNSIFNKMSYVSRMNAKMINGEALTAAEKAKLIRYTRRLNLSNLLNGDNITPFMSVSSNNYDDLKTLIAG